MVKNGSNRIYYLDILRVMACIAVIVTHASFIYVMADFGSFNFIVGNIADSLSRIGVPLFVMISGSLLLDKDYVNNNQKQLNRIIKMIMFFLFWSSIYLLLFDVYLPLKQGNGISISKLINSFIIGHYHLWYIYMIVGLYLIVPLLRLWVNYENITYIKYFILLAFTFAFFIPQVINIGMYFSDKIDTFQIVLNYTNLSYVGGYTLYFILGWYLRNYEIKYKHLLYFFGILSIIFEIFMTHFLSVTFNQPIQLYDNLSVNVLFQSVMVFVFVKSKYQNYDKRESYFIRTISKYSLGIYAIHAGIIDLIIRYCDFCKKINVIFTIVFMILSALLGSLLISMIMSKVKPIKKYLL